VKRPTLKTPQVKPPGFVSDLYLDLRDRRLLPVLALVLVAIVATPILLGQSSDTALPPQASGALEALKEAQDGSSASLTVVEAKPGLRDPDKRLAQRSPTDPFKQRYTAPVLKGSQLNEAKEGEGSGATEAGEGAEDKSSGATTGKQTATNTGKDGGSPQPGDTAKPKDAVLYNFAIDFQIVHASGSEKEGDKKVSEPQVRTKVLPPAPLPGKKKAVVTYIGLSPKTRKPLFVVSPEVTGTFGDAKCVSGTETCQLIELEPGFPQVFVYGDKGDRYTLKLRKVYFVVIGRI